MSVPALENIFLLVMCMAVGFIARKVKILKAGDMRGFVALILDITLPALLIMAMQREFEMEAFRGSLVVMGITTLTSIAALGLALAITKAMKVTGAERAVLMLGLVFPNVGFMGIPLIYAMYGQDAMLYTAMVNSVANIVVPTVGIAILLGAESRTQIKVKSILLNKIILATLIGFALFVFSIQIPELIGNGLRMIGGATTPLSMIIIGSMLAENDLKGMFSGWKIYVVALFRLIAAPLITFVVLDRLVADRLAVTVITMLTAMPVAAITAILAAEHGKEPQLASKVVFITTVLSIATIPLMLMIIG